MTPKNLTGITEADYAALAGEFSEFTYLVSHDLGAPVRGMVEFARLLKTEHADALNDEAKLYLSLIFDNGQKLQRMLDGLLDYSRLDLSHPVVETDCAALFQECRSALHAEIAQAGAGLTVGPLPKFNTNRAGVLKLFTLLLDNAVKYRSPGRHPQISLTAEPVAGGYRFCLQDDGIGIELEYREKVFKPFKRLHGDAEYQGVGLGLAIARKIVAALGGSISLESAAPQGLVVEFFIPVSA